MKNAEKFLWKKKLKSIGIRDVSSFETFKRTLMVKITDCLRDGKKLVVKTNEKYSLIVDKESMGSLTNDQVLKRVVDSLYRKRSIMAIKDTKANKHKIHKNELESFLDIDSVKQLF